MSKETDREKPMSMSPGEGDVSSQETPTSSGAAQAQPEPVKRWTGQRKYEVVKRLLRGESIELVSRELGVPPYKLEQWLREAETAMEKVLKGQTKDKTIETVRELHRHIGELTVKNELLEEIVKVCSRPLPPGRPPR
ncbi:transposase [Myxococcota bacterium]|nr:transposase [Myxococcota bacterium]